MVIYVYYTNIYNISWRSKTNYKYIFIIYHIYVYVDKSFNRRMLTSSNRLWQTLERGKKIKLSFKFTYLSDFQLATIVHIIRQFKFFNLHFRFDGLRRRVKTNFNKAFLYEIKKLFFIGYLNTMSDFCSIIFIFVQRTTPQLILFCTNFSVTYGFNMIF